MLSNQVDAQLTLQDIMAALDTIRTKLPFLIGLSIEERRRLSKLGRKSQTFTHQALDVAQQHPELMPRFFDVEEARRDMALFIALNPVLQAVSELQVLIRDTQTLAGSEAYAAARMAYAAAKTMGHRLGLEDVVEQLSQRYDRNGSFSSSQPEAQAE